MSRKVSTMREPDDNPAAAKQWTTSRRAFLKLASAAGASAGLASAGLPASSAVLAQAATPIVNATPTVGGTIHVGVAAEIKVLDPQATTLAAYHSTIRFTIFETLLEVDDNGKYVPNL